MKERPHDTTPTQGENAEILRAKEQGELKRVTNIISVCLVPAAICIGLGVYAFFVGWRDLSRGGKHISEWGNFGSYLQGTTGSLWALASVFIIFVAFLMQMRQLFEQREQFRIQRQQQEIELENQRKQFE